MADVPFTAIACFAPVYSDIFLSNRLTYFPAEETQPLSMQSIKYLTRSHQKMENEEGY